MPSVSVVIVALVVEPVEVKVYSSHVAPLLLEKRSLKPVSEEPLPEGAVHETVSLPPPETSVGALAGLAGRPAFSAPAPRTPRRSSASRAWP